MPHCASKGKLSIPPEMKTTGLAQLTDISKKGMPVVMWGATLASCSSAWRVARLFRWDLGRFNWKLWNALTLNHAQEKCFNRNHKKLADGFFLVEDIWRFFAIFHKFLQIYVILEGHVASYTAAVMPGHSSHLESQWQSAEHRATHHARGLGLGHWFWTMRMIISCSHFGCFFRDQFLRVLNIWW